MERFIVERIRDGVFLDLDFPIDVSGAGRKLSGAGSLSGTVEPDVGGLRDTGELIAEPGASFIHREVAGVITGSYVVTRCAFKGSAWDVEGQGFSSHLARRYYSGSREWVNADPISIVRHVWEHAQGKPGGDLGVTVKGSSPVRIGEPKRDVNFQTRAGEDVDFTAGPYTLHWWDTPNLGQAVDGLAESASSEFVEWSAWDADKSKILKEVRYASRIGKRSQARFVEGANVVDVVALESDGTDYANTVIAIGAGEGQKALRVTLSVSDGRVPMERVLDLKNVTSKKVLEASARAALALAQKKYAIPAVEVVDHPNAEFGTFDVGDEVLVSADFEWAGRKELWHRITEIEWVGDRARLMLEVV